MIVTWDFFCHSVQKIDIEKLEVLEISIFIQNDVKYFSKVKFQGFQIFE